MKLKTAARRALSLAGYEIAPAQAGKPRIRAVPKDRRTIHFLHIGKNAGTQIATVARQINAQVPELYIHKREHDVMLRDLPAEAPYFFSIRNPVKRFVSGFYSRKRKGQPRMYKEWSPHEAQAFGQFEHAVDLAESLFADGPLGHQAFAAIKSMRHTAQAQVDWFMMEGHFLDVRPPLWIIRQEAFDQDLKVFLDRLGAPADIALATDNRRAHKTDYTDIPPLTDKARENLRAWYRQDVEFYAMCAAWIESQDTSNALVQKDK